MVAAQRVLCSPPDINPVVARLSYSVQTSSLHCTPLDHRRLLARNAGSFLYLKWLQPRPPSKNRTHFPIDALAYSMLVLLGLAGNKPPPVTSQHLLLESYPEPPPARSCAQLKQKCRDLQMDERHAAGSDPANYRYPPSLKPHTYIGLKKFNTGWIHRMRSDKSYCMAHPLSDSTKSKTCQRCGDGPETFDYAIIGCPAKAPARDRPLQGGSELSPDTPILSFVALLHTLSRFIRSTHTALPAGMLDHPSSAALSVSSDVSSMSSFCYILSSQER